MSIKNLTKFIRLSILPTAFLKGPRRTTKAIKPHITEERMLPILCWETEEIQYSLFLAIFIYIKHLMTGTNCEPCFQY